MSFWLVLPGYITINIINGGRSDVSLGILIHPVQHSYDGHRVGVDLTTVVR